HARNLAAHPRACVRTIVDPVARLAADLARELGASTAPDAAAALADGDIDAVVIASSTNTHVDLIMASARRGKAVLCEKPIDLDRWLLEPQPVELVAKASCQVDPKIARAGDVDSAMAILKTRSGVLCHINNSRRAVYGYDQRVEVFGAKGMVRSDNLRPTTIV